MMRFELPSFAVGHSNIQFLSLRGDYYMPMTKEEAGRVKNTSIEAAVRINMGQVTADLEQVQIRGNVKVLEYVSEVLLLVDDTFLTFTTDTHARPFNGVFDA